MPCPKNCNRPVSASSSRPGGRREREDGGEVGEGHLRACEVQGIIQLCNKYCMQSHVYGHAWRTKVERHDDHVVYGRRIPGGCEDTRGILAINQVIPGHSLPCVFCQMHNPDSA